MKCVLFTICLLFTAVFSFGQTCTPDPTLADSAVGIYPLPYDSMTMQGGIDEPACLGEFYEYTLNVRVPETVEVSGIPVGIDSIVVTGFANLPVGLDFSCSPSDCSVTPADEIGCLYIFGTVDNSNAVGDYVLAVEGTAYTGLGQFSIEELIDLIALTTGSTGGQSYFITVQESGCVTSTTTIPEDQLSMEVFPNPAAGSTQLNLQLESAMDLQWQLFNPLGQLIQTQNLALSAGMHRQVLNLQNVPAGLYFLNIRNEKGQVRTTRLVVQ